MKQTVKMMKRSALLLSISLLTVAIPAYAADEVMITPLERQVSTGGRGIVTLRFEIENRSGQTRDWQEQLSLPDGWELISTPAPFPLTAGQREVRLVHISVPRGVASGTYPVRYSVNARDNNSISGMDTVNVRIESVQKTELLVTSTPTSLLAGENYTASFQLRNSGNRTSTYTIRVNDDDGYVTSITPKALTLQPGESGDIQVAGEIDARLIETDTHHFTVVAKGGGETSEQSVSIPIISRIPKGLGKWQTLPGELRLSYSGQTNNSNSQGNQWQAEYNAQGTLDEDGKHNVALRLRNGSKTTETNTALQEEYRASYWNGDWKITAGHQGFYSSRLAGNSLTGIGTEVIYTPQDEEKRKPLEVRVFDGKSRPGVTSEIVRGANAKYRFDGARVEMGASVLKYQKQGESTQDITGANIAWSGDNLTIRAETAKDKDASAQAIDLSTHMGDISANLSHLKSDPNFSGANQNTKQSYGGISWQIDKRTRISGNLRRTQNNLAEDTSKEIRHDQEQQIHISHDLGDERDITITAGYRVRKEQDRRPTPTTDRNIKAALIEYRQNFDTFDISGQWEQGKRDDRINTSGTGSKQQLAVNWHPDQNLNIGSTLSRDKGLETENNSTSIGINGRYHLNKRQEINSYWQHTKSKETSSSSDSFNLGYKHTLKNRHTIDFNTTYSRNNAIDASQTKNNYWRVEYIMPLDSPIRKRNNIGVLGGIAYYADSDEPAKDMVLELDGQYAVTDEEGIYVFPDILAKEYQLQVDPSRSNGTNYMLGEEGGIRTVKVEPNKLTQVDLPLQPGASLYGTVKTYHVNKAIALQKINNDQEKLLDGDGLGGILLELQPTGENTDSRRTYKRLTDTDGSFNFLGIPPGEWQLIVIDADKLPAHHRVEQQQFHVILQEGDNPALTVRVLPTEQTIQKTGPTGGFHVSG